MSDDAATPKASSPGRDAVFTLNPHATVAYRMVRRIVRAVLTLWFHPSVEGPGRVPHDGPVIITPVHRSFIDFGFAIFLTDRKLFFIAKDSLWKLRILGRFLWRWVRSRSTVRAPIGPRSVMRKRSFVMGRCSCCSRRAHDKRVRSSGTSSKVRRS